MANTKPVVILSPETVASIVAATVVKLGPDTGAGYYQRLTNEASRLLLMCQDGSRLVQRLNLVANAVTFTGVVTGIVKEESSQRGIITLKTGKAGEKLKYQQKGLPDGFEQIRTDRVDSNDDAKDMCRNIQKNLIGHKVALTIIREPMSSDPDTVVRIAIAVRDLGESDDPEVIQNIRNAA